MKMENQEEILDALNDFEKKRGKDIPPLLDQFLSRVARTGETLFPWPRLKPLLVTKLELVMQQFNREFPLDHLPLFPNVENVKFEEMRSRIITALEKFHGAPFTIQRICELVTDPTRHYKRCDKFLRGIEKNVMVVSTVDPFGRKIVSESKNMMNGLDMNGHSLGKVEQPFSSIPNPPIPNWMSEYIKRTEPTELSADSTNLNSECDHTESMSSQEKTNDNRTDIDRLEQAPIVCEVHEQQEKTVDDNQMNCEEIAKTQQELEIPTPEEPVESGSGVNRVPSEQTEVPPEKDSSPSPSEQSPEVPPDENTSPCESGNKPSATPAEAAVTVCKTTSSTPTQEQTTEDSNKNNSSAENNTTQDITDHSCENETVEKVCVSTEGDESEGSESLETEETNLKSTEDQKLEKVDNLCVSEQVSDTSLTQESKTDQIVSSSVEVADSAIENLQSDPDSETLTPEKSETSEVPSDQENNENVKTDSDESKTETVKMDCDVQENQETTTEDNSEVSAVSEMSATVEVHEQNEQPMEEN